MHRVPSLLVALSLAACHPRGDVSSEDQLEAVSMEARDSAGEGVGEFEVQGVATVSGEERDFQVSIEDAESPVVLEIHAPGRSDLSSLDGRVLSAFRGEEDEMFGEVEIKLVDETGPAWFAMAAPEPEAADGVFGAGFLQWGEEVGRERQDGDRYRFHSILAATDEGEVELLPGEPAVLVKDGVTWRAVLIAAYQVDPKEEMDCGSPDLVSIELLRIEAEPEAEELIARPEEAAMAEGGACG